MCSRASNFLHTPPLFNPGFVGALKRVEGHLVLCKHWKDVCHTLVSVGGTQRPAVKLQWATCREELVIDRIADKAFSGIVSSRVDGRFPCKSLLAYSLSAASFVFPHITASSSCDPRGEARGATSRHPAYRRSANVIVALFSRTVSSHAASAPWGFVCKLALPARCVTTKEMLPDMAFDNQLRHWKT